MEDSKENIRQLTERIYRLHYRRTVAVLVHYFGLQQISIAEDIVQDTLMEGMEQWGNRGIPDKPEAWIMDVAKKRLINYLKREQHLRHVILPGLEKVKSESQRELKLERLIKDSTLRMIFACCHPELPPDTQVALALKSLCGFTIAEIAHCLLTSETTINKRLYRARQKFRDKKITLMVPTDDAFEERLSIVCTTLYLLFNEGYYSRHHRQTIRIELCFEAIRLLEAVLESFPDSVEAQSLLALMLLNFARFESRLDQDGALIILQEQDRSLWDRSLISRGMEILSNTIARPGLNKYQIQAGIAAEHCLAPDFAATNWESIYRQYGLLEKLDDSAYVLFNKAIARFYADDPAAALAELLALEKKATSLFSSALFQLTLGVLHARINKKAEALAHFETALQRSPNPSELQLIRHWIKR